MDDLAQDNLVQMTLADSGRSGAKAAGARTSGRKPGRLEDVTP
jgi:hypothetical protein